MNVLRIRTAMNRSWRLFSTLDVAAVASLVSAKSPGRTRRLPIGQHKFDADLVVIGGGSGGLACAREASKLGASVVVLDAVTPSPLGTTWGLGGTCVNVGCIPKKLMHQAGLLGTALRDAKEYGWQLDPSKVTHDWSVLRDAVQDYIRGTNWGYRSALRQEDIEYINAFGSLIDDHHVLCRSPSGKEQVVSGNNIVIAVGGRPAGLPSIPGSESLCISSDDLFSLEQPPGKTLVIGAGYVALECAGFLTSLGYDSTVMMRSIPLRGFDTEMAAMVVDYMQRHGTRFLRGVVPVSMQRAGDRQVAVTWQDDRGGTNTDVFDTVLVATGRHAATKSLNLGSVGVKTAANGKIIGREASGAFAEHSSVDSIFAIGDCLEGKPELTPAAIRAGRQLAHRMFREQPGARPGVMDYVNIPTTVFTPLEYACVGMSEEAAVAKHGAAGVEVYHLAYDTLEMAVAHRSSASGALEKAACYVKAVCTRAMGEPVVGLHLLGPHAGEVMQGFSVALHRGLTMEDLTSSVGIHPTQAEEFVLLDRTKRSGVSAVKTSC